MDSYFEKVSMPDERFKIKSFVSSTFEHAIEVHPHWHTEVEILYVINGYAKQQVNDQIFIAEPGDIVVIGKDQLHSTYSYGGSRCDIWVIMFDALTIFEEASTSVYSNSLLFKNPIKSSDRYRKLLLDCIIEIHEELAEKKDSYYHYVKSLLYRMTGIFSRYKYYEIFPKDEKNIQIVKQTLKKTFKLIDEFYYEDISLEKAASASNLSIPHFCRLFKKATGMTFNNYLTFYRINRAERMLNSQKAITDVALECGFGSVSSFARNFKKLKQCTPSSYKKLYDSNNTDMTSHKVQECAFQSGQG